MENPGELIAIKAFADAAGRSQQAIYKQINTRLAPYVHEKDGQKFIERRALAEVFGIGDIKPNQPQKTAEQRNVEQRLYANMQAMIDMLQDQIRVKDQQMEEKDRQLAAKDKQIENLTETVRAQAESLQAAQALHAGTMQQMLPEQSESTVVVEDVADEEPPAEPLRKWKVFDWFRGK